ncbi:methyl-accepting chemotaxis protein [Cytobacillus sp. Hz8]|uniref:methyl-accepting chemotaxis protein n=1 Tax=Cytobacillus sp. Hz8 TaxID=3347168 RepID=UPI0035DB1E95
MKWIKNVKMLSKMIILSVIVLVSLLSIGGVGFSQITKMGTSLENMYKQNLIPIETISLMKSNQQYIQTSLLELLITKDQNGVNELLSDIDRRTKENESLRGKYKSSDAAEKGLLIKLDQLTKNFNKHITDFISIASEDKKEEAYNLYESQLEPTEKELDATFTKLVSMSSQEAKVVNEDNKKEIKSSLTIMIAIIVIALIIITLISWIITRAIVNPIKEMESVMKKAESGDISAESSYQSKDEIGALSRSYNEMLAQIRNVIMKVREASDMVAASSEELLASAEQTSDATDHIAQASTELASGSESSVQGAENASISMGNIAVGIANISESIENVTTHSNVTNAESQKGDEAITKTIEQMGTINESVAFSSDVIKHLGARSEEIEKIVGVISGISDQTNLLALNAAIEAARAGEHGKGFAVVADEVRKLAEESRKSAEQITNLIRDIQENTNNSVVSMEKCTNEVETGMLLVNHTGESFKKILNSALDVSKQVEEVSRSIGQISASVENLAMNMVEVSMNAENSAQNTHNIAAGAQQQLASMEEITASAHSLAGMADDLRKMVSAFKVSE